MFKILQAGLQQYMNWELPDIKAGFIKGRRTRDQIANIHWIIVKVRELQKNIYFCFTDYAKAFVWIITNWEILKGWEYQTALPASWETCMQIKMQQLEPDIEQWAGSKIEKGVCQDCILSFCLFYFYAEYIMQNAGLDEAQAGTKISRRNINDLRYADDTTLMAESEEELKSLLMKVKGESEKVALKLNIQKNKIMASGPITSWQIDGETIETVSDFIFLGSKSLQLGTAAVKLKDTYSLERKLWPT